MVGLTFDNSKKRRGRVSPNLSGAALPKFPAGKVNPTIPLDHLLLREPVPPQPSDHFRAPANAHRRRVHHHRRACPEDDQTQNGEEVEGVSGYTVESDEGAELADDDVDGYSAASVSTPPPRKALQQPADFVAVPGPASPSPVRK
jgi:hypothetical protein